MKITDEDREFVLDNINHLLALDRPLTLDDIVAERCGVRPLAVKGASQESDWLKLSRQHAIDINSNDQHISIFGGKLTDCINVGNEIAEIVSTLGVTLPDSDKVWFGEPDAADKENFFKQAEAMDLDKNTAPTASEPLSNRND